MITLVIWRRNRLLDRLLPARFGHPKDFCLGVEAWSTPSIGNQRMHTYSNKLILRRLLLLPASQYSYPRLLRSNMHAADVCICWSVCNMAPHSCVCFKPLCPKKQSFRYPNLAAVFHVSKLLCSSLSGIQNLQHLWRNQTLQQSNSFTYPNNLTAVFHVSKPCRQQPRRRSSILPNHWLQDVLHKAHPLWYSVVALDGGLCSEFPTLYKQVQCKQTQ